MAYLGNAPVVGDSTNSFKLLDDIASFTLTFDATDTSVVSISGDTLSFTNHRFVTGQKVTYTDGGGTAIGGLTDGTSYFIIKVDQNTIKLATNASNAASSTAINLTSGAAGGSHTLKVAFDGVNTKFKATHGNGTKASVSRAGQISLSINGVIQQPQDSSSPSVGYGVEADSTIVFSTAPAATDKVFATFIGEVAPSFDITDNTIDNFTGDGSTTIFNLSKEVPSSQDVLVTLDGVTQHPSDGSTTRSYSIVNQALTFVSAPATGVAIQARHIGFAGATTSAVTGFYGRTGNTALTSTDDISVQNISGVGATFTGNVNIEGVLTYEDVTNVDSIGIITARAGVLVGSGITLSKDGDGFFTGVCTATSFVGDGSALTGITQTTINNNANNRIITGSGTANTLEGEANLTFNGSTLTLDGDATFTTANGNNIIISKSGNDLTLGDSVYARFGAGDDLSIGHDGSNSYIGDNGTGSLVIYGTEIRLKSANTLEDMLKATENAGVQLYYDNSAKLETRPTGVRMQNTSVFDVNGGTIQFGHSSSSDDRLKFGSNETDLQIFHGGNGQFDVNTGDVVIRNTGDFSSSREIYLMARVDEQSVTCYSDGAVELFYDNSKKLQTTADGIILNAASDISHSSADNLQLGTGSGSNGITIYSGSDSNGSVYFADGSSGNQAYRGFIEYSHNSDSLYFGSGGNTAAYFDSSLNFLPSSDNARNLGSSSKRWANLYTTDLQLSNEGKTNDVDGTWGDYTIQEGESDLFLINNRSGKKYKFNLTEVS